MAIGFSPENKQFIEHKLQVGTFGSRAELLNQAVGLLKRRRDLQREIQAGIDSGPSISADQVFERLERRAQHLADGESL
jgi:putative addiction module CopG family antidote